MVLLLLTQHEDDHSRAELHVKSCEPGWLVESHTNGGMCMDFGSYVREPSLDLKTRLSHDLDLGLDLDHDSIALTELHSLLLHTLCMHQTLHMLSNHLSTQYHVLLPI